MRRPAIILALAAAGIVVSGALPAAAQTIRRETARPIVSILGSDNYEAYCAVCHGRDGRGHGPAAPALKARVPNLSTLAWRNGGRFSHNDVERAILGKGTPMAAHGPGNMPNWGQVFRAFDRDTGMCQLRIANLVRHIESMQQQ
jgi:hypothetical protein